MTPIPTILDMIFENPFTEDVLIRFFKKLPENGGDILKTFKQIVHELFSLTKKDINQFSTPNFKRVLNLSSSSNGQHILSEEEVVDLRANLNNIGRRFLQEEMERIKDNRV